MDTKLKKDKFNVNLVVILISVLITLISFIAGFWDIDYYLSLNDLEFTQLLSTLVWMKSACLWPMVFCVIILSAILVIFRAKIRVKENFILSFYKKIFLEFKIAFCIFLYTNLRYTYSIVKYWYSYDVYAYKHGPFLQMIVNLVLLYCIISELINIYSLGEKVNLLKKTAIYYVYSKKNTILSFCKKICKAYKNTHLIILSVLIAILCLLIGRIIYMNQFNIYYVEDDIQMYKIILALISFLIFCYISILEYEIIQLKEIAASILKGENIEKKNNCIFLMI